MSPGRSILFRGPSSGTRPQTGSICRNAARSEARWRAIPMREWALHESHGQGAHWGWRHTRPAPSLPLPPSIEASSQDPGCLPLRRTDGCAHSRRQAGHRQSPRHPRHRTAASRFSMRLKHCARARRRASPWAFDRARRSTRWHPPEDDPSTRRRHPLPPEAS